MGSVIHDARNHHDAPPGSSLPVDWPLTARQVEELVGNDPTTRETLLQALIAGVQGKSSGSQARSSRAHARRIQPVTYQVRVDLDGAKPPIWRRLLLSSELMLDELHVVLQQAMGWDGGHLH